METQRKVGSHSVFKLNYHLVLCTKYRRKILKDQIDFQLKEIFSRISQNNDVRIIEMESDEDHIHLLFSTDPTTNLTKYINSLKTTSSRLIQKEHPQPNRLFWSRSYFLSTVGEVSLDTIKNYVKTQGNSK